MPELGELVKIEITKLLPETGVVDSTYKIEGTVKMFDAIGAPPWVYAEVTKKEWYLPEAVEEVSYKRGFPMPISGEFSIDFKPDKEGDYEVKVVATPAPLPLPAIGVQPVLAESDVMEFKTIKAPPAAFRFSGVTIDGNYVPLTDHHTDSGLLLAKTTADYLDILPAFEWTGPRKDVVISIKVGYRSLLLGFEPRTGAYTKAVVLPESPYVPYEGALEEPIRIPLTNCPNIGDGAIEMVLKITGFPDYISQIWNVYSTKVPKIKEVFDIIGVTVNDRHTTNKINDVYFDFVTPELMTTEDKLNINFDFQWIGPKTTVTVEMRVGHEALIPHDFAPRTGYYSVTVELPAASEAVPFVGSLTKPITIPLTNCPNIGDGAIEIKIGNYISQIWNVYNTKVLELETLEIRIDPYGAGTVTTDPEPVGGVQHKWTFIHDTEVYVTAHPNPGYIFKSWSGEMKDTTLITAPVSPMTEHRLITAHFEKVAVAPPPELEITGLSVR